MSVCGPYAHVRAVLYFRRHVRKSSECVSNSSRDEGNYRGRKMAPRQRRDHGFLPAVGSMHMAAELPT